MIKNNNNDIFDFLKPQSLTNLFDKINENNRWNFVNIDFFDFYYNDKITIIILIIEYIDKNIYFRNIYIFIK